MTDCNHVFIVRGDKYICEKCGDEFKLGEFASNELEISECPGGRCPV